MKRKDLYRLINEEVSEFDFLSMSNIKEEDDFNGVLESKEFQTNLIKDIITDILNKDKFTKASATYVNKDVDMHNDVERIELEIEVTYTYDEKDYDLILFISGDKDDEEINYENLNIKLFSKAGDRLNIDWVENNSQLYKKLIESLVLPYLAD